MIDLHKFFINPFDDNGISMSELLSFSSDHLQRMIANNPGALYATRIAATTTAMNTVNTQFADDQTMLGQRKAKKQTKKAFRKSLLPAIAKIAGVVTGFYGESSPATSEIFPHGRTIFGKASDDQLGNYLQVTITGLTAHQADLGATVVTNATALLTNWNSVYGLSESSAGNKTASQLAKNNARLALQLELFRNLLTIALNNPRLPEQLDVYMQQSLLLNPVPPAPPSASTAPPPPKV